MEMKYAVTHREYYLDGSFCRSFTLPQDEKDFAIEDANLVLDYYNETDECMSVKPCNITVRGPKGRFIKWKN